MEFRVKTWISPQTSLSKFTVQWKLEYREVRGPDWSPGPWMPCEQSSSSNMHNAKEEIGIALKRWDRYFSSKNNIILSSSQIENIEEVLDGL